jgi:sigma-B regulation protein RsbU (phosphoserine phosphatase)
MNSDVSSSDPGAEAIRVAAVRRYRDLDTGSDTVFGDVASLAARLYGVPMAIVSLVDEKQIWFLATHGLDADTTQIAREEGLCGLVIDGKLPHVIADAQNDPVTASRAFVHAHAVRFYACAPMVTVQGDRVGAVAVLDTAVREDPSREQLGMLQDLAALVIKQLDLHASARESVRVERRMRDAAEYDRDDAREDRDTAHLIRDQARRDRDVARVDRGDAERDRAGAWRDRDDARADRDGAVRDREAAERDRDLVEAYATALQATLLPPVLPTVAGVSLAAHYRAASSRQVGGDFYDVFPMGGSRWGFFLGDVEGHGVSAAVATSLIRYTLRAAALHHPNDPTAVLAELNAVMLGELQPRRFCTVLSGTLAPHPSGDGWHLTLATGGHQPALLLDPQKRVAFPVRPSTGMLVGMRAEATFGACSLWLRPGQTLVLYTDGLVEARRGDDAFDEDSLAEFTALRASTDAGELISDIATLAAKLDPDDDVAALAIKATAPRIG